MNKITFENGVHLSKALMEYMQDAWQGPGAWMVNSVKQNCIIYGIKTLGNGNYSEGAIVYNGEAYPFYECAGSNKFVIRSTEINNIYKNGSSHKVSTKKYVTCVESDSDILATDISLGNVNNWPSLKHSITRKTGDSVSISLDSGVQNITDETILKRYAMTNNIGVYLTLHSSGKLLISGAVTKENPSFRENNTIGTISGLTLDNAVVFNAKAIYVTVNGTQTDTVFSDCMVMISTSGVMLWYGWSYDAAPKHIIFKDVIVDL